MAKDKAPNAKTKLAAKGKQTADAKAKAAVELVKGKEDSASAKSKEAKAPPKTIDAKANKDSASAKSKDDKAPLKTIDAKANKDKASVKGKDDKAAAKGKKAKDSKMQKTAAPAKSERGFMGRMRRLGRYFRDMFSELKKATWPTRKEVVKYTSVVLAFVTILAVIIGLLDFGFTELLKLITG